ncbi:MAG: phage terminase large subunit family protein [Clostridia bacterium]|nr:phage terminase large subunit family protein [Clostridia bacterium]
MRKYTKEEMEEYWMARCPECGWKGLSCDCYGFGAIADTGDYEDGYCPKCGAIVNDEEYEPIRFVLWFLRFITFYRIRKMCKNKLLEYKYMIYCNKIRKHARKGDKYGCNR